MGKSVTRSNLPKANKQHDYRIFEEYAHILIAEAQAPTSFHITTASTNDMKAIPEIPYEKVAKECTSGCYHRVNRL